MKTITDEQLEKIVYALTISDRGGDRDKWLRRGIPKLENISDGGLLGYWRRRVDSDPSSMSLALKTWKEYEQAVEDLASGKLTRPGQDLQTVQMVKPPSLLEMAGTLVKAAAAETKAVIAQEPPVSEEEYVRRLKLCGTCDLYEKEAGRCSSCGCYMIYKAKMRSQSCPLGKWGNVR